MTFTPVLLIDFVGIAVGLVSIFMMFTLKKSIGGRMGNIINLVVGGVSFNILAFGYTVTFTRLKLFSIPGGIDVHHILMTVGMILFVLAARKFSLLGQP